MISPYSIININDRRVKLNSVALEERDSVSFSQRQRIFHKIIINMLIYAKCFFYCVQENWKGTICYFSLILIPSKISSLQTFSLELE